MLDTEKAGKALFILDQAVAQATLNRAGTFQAVDAVKTLDAFIKEVNELQKEVAAAKAAAVSDKQDR